ncbi:putative Phosphoserine phosphatase, partial [Cardiosporidium cionae]
TPNASSNILHNLPFEASFNSYISSEALPPIHTIDYIVVLMQNPRISPNCLIKLFEILASSEININSFDRLSYDGFRALQLNIRIPFDFTAMEDLKSKLFQCGAEFGADIALQKDDILCFCRRLVVFDMDSTLIQQEVIDELARCAGKMDEIAEITNQAMLGQLEFTESITRRVAMLEGVASEASFSKVQNTLELTPGALHLCKILRFLGYRLAVVSGGFTYFAREIKRKLGLHHAFANSLDINEEGNLTGKLVGPIVTPQRKASLLRMLADIYECSVEQV